MRTGSQSLKILAVALVLCVLWTLIRARMPQPELAETNYTANRLRIEQFLGAPTPRFLIVGTSIAGRLLPSYFEGSKLENIVNLGLDGSSPMTGLRLALSRAQTPELILLEAHRLWNPIRANDKQLLAVAQGMDRIFHDTISLTKAENRPTTLLYGWLRSQQRQEGGQIAEPKGPINDIQNPKTVPKPEDLVQTIQALEARGSKVVLVRLPVGHENPVDPNGQDDVDQLAKDLGLPVIDLYRQSFSWKDPVRYTDGLHLAPESARRLARVLAEQGVR